MTRAAGCYLARCCRLLQQNDRPPGSSHRTQCAGVRRVSSQLLIPRIRTWTRQRLAASVFCQHLTEMTLTKSPRCTTDTSAPLASPPSPERSSAPRRNRRIIPAHLGLPWAVYLLIMNFQLGSQTAATKEALESRSGFRMFSTERQSRRHCSRSFDTTRRIPHSSTSSPSSQKYPRATATGP